MKVNVVIGDTDLNWIGGRFTRELQARLPALGWDVTVNGPVADLDYHQIVYGVPKRRPAVGMFTHGDTRPKLFGAEYDGQIALNSAMHQYLVDAVGPASPVIIELPVDEKFHDPLITFGVAGRTYADGRKGEHLVKAMIADGYRVRAWGSGWPCQIQSDRLEDLPAFYESIDYYIDTSSDEGGCVPALEAMAMGVPVISHTHGVDRPVIPYKKHDWISLRSVLRALTRPRTYDEWARDHARYFHAVVTQNWTSFWEQSA